MRIRVLGVGRLKSGYEKELCARYLDRAAAVGRQIGLTGFEVDEIPESRKRDAMQRCSDEGEQLVRRLPPNTRKVVLDEAGDALSSAQFAGIVGRWRDEGAPELAFLIGGPDGHGSVARDGADLVLGFGAMTWPHQLVRVMLAEQLYRAATILSGHPYHRA